MPGITIEDLMAKGRAVKVHPIAHGSARLFHYVISKEPAETGACEIIAAFPVAMVFFHANGSSIAEIQFVGGRVGVMASYEGDYEVLCGEGVVLISKYTCGNRVLFHCADLDHRYLVPLDVLLDLTSFDFRSYEKLVAAEAEAVGRSG